MKQLSVAERMDLLINFAHGRDEEPLTEVELAGHASSFMSAPVAAETVAAIRAGAISLIHPDLADALCRAAGQRPGNGWFLTLPAADRRVQEKIAQLEMLITARSLGVQHIAARDTSDDPAAAVAQAEEQLRHIADLD